jgi:hypothetical protein
MVSRTLDANILYKINVPVHQLRNVLPIENTSYCDDESEVILPIGGSLTFIKTSTFETTILTGQGVERKQVILKYNEYTYSYPDTDQQENKDILCKGQGTKVGLICQGGMPACSDYLPMSKRWALDISDAVAFNGGNKHKRSICKNCPPKSLVKKYYTGKENSPLGKGYSSYFEIVGKKRMGNDGKKWAVVQIANGTKKWKCII